MKKKEHERQIKLLRGWLERQPFRFAKTYAKFAPHSYIVKQKLPVIDQPWLEWAVKMIDLNGVPMKFKKRWYIVMIFGDKRYWSTGNPDIGKFLINRAEQTKEYHVNEEFAKKMRWFSKMVEWQKNWELYRVNEKRYWKVDETVIDREKLENMYEMVHHYGIPETIKRQRTKLLYLCGYKYWFDEINLVDKKYILNRTEP